MNLDEIENNTWKWDAVPAGAGVLEIRRRTDGKSYFVAVADMRQRASDAHRLLMAGTHHCPELQTAWSADPKDFEIITVASVRREAYLRAFKQTYVEQAGDNCWNRKNSISSQSSRRASTAIKSPDRTDMKF